jgi:hypothetical protein
VTVIAIGVRVTGHTDSTRAVLSRMPGMNRLSHAHQVYRLLPSDDQPVGKHLRDREAPEPDDGTRAVVEDRAAVQRAADRVLGDVERGPESADRYRRALAQQAVECNSNALSGSVESRLGADDLVR